MSIRTLLLCVGFLAVLPMSGCYVVHDTGPKYKHRPTPRVYNHRTTPGHHTTPHHRTPTPAPQKRTQTNQQNQTTNVVVNVRPVIMGPPVPEPRDVAPSASREHRHHHKVKKVKKVGKDKRVEDDHDD